MKKFLLTATFALIGFVLIAQEKIAVFPFEDMENIFTKNEAVLFYRNFSNEFTNKTKDILNVVPRSDIEKLIEIEAGFQKSKYSERIKTAEGKRVLNGTQILSGVVGRFGNSIQISVSLYTYPELRQLPGGVDMTVSNKDELLKNIPELVQKMYTAMTGNSVADQSIPDGFSYEIIDNTVTITGYNGNAKTVQIPSQIQGLPVTTIGRVAFSQNKSLTSINIPASVISIENNAFSECESLISITIPASVTSIAYNSFYDCKSLTNISVDNRNPTYASIDGVLFDKNMQILKHYPADKTAQLYTIPSTVNYIQAQAFSDCLRLTRIIIPSSVTSIGDYAFCGCENLTNINIPSSVTYIGMYAFCRCENLTSIGIPSSVTCIEYNLFNGCKSLTSITIPASVTSIVANPFIGCKSLSNISVNNLNSAYASIDGVLFDKNIQILITYPAGRTAQLYIIPSSVTSIGNDAFINCESLTNITIPPSVTSIGGRAFWGVSLTSITIPSSVSSIGDHAFSYCYSLTSITIPLSVTSIKEFTFNSCRSLTNITIPSSVTSIERRAFIGCEKLTNITIPPSVTSIGESAFAFTKLSTVFISRRTNIGKNAFPANARITYSD